MEMIQILEDDKVDVIFFIEKYQNKVDPLKYE